MHGENETDDHNVTENGGLHGVKVYEEVTSTVFAYTPQQSHPLPVGTSDRRLTKLYYRTE